MNKKAIILEVFFAIVLLIIIIFLFYLNKDLIVGKAIIKEKASISGKGIDYSSELQSDNELNERIAIVSYAILKISIGLAILIFAVTYLIKHILKFKASRQKKESLR